MDPNQNPYNAPLPDANAELRIIRRRRKLTNIAMTALLSVVLLAAYLGVRMLFAALNNWLFGSR